MQMSNDDQVVTKHPQFTHFMKTIQQHHKWLVILNQQILKQNIITVHSATLLMNGYFKLGKKLQERIKLPKPKISDYLYMVAPDILIGVYTLQYLIGKGEKMRSGSQLGEISKLLEVQGLSEEEILKIPIKFAKQTLANQIKVLESHLDQEIYQEDKQKRTLLEFYSWFTNALGMEIFEDLPADKKRKMIILSQYNLPHNKAYENVKKYGKILVFFKTLKRRSKQVQKKIKDRQMKILELLDGQKNYVRGLEDYIKYIKNPIQELNILTQQQKKKIFSSIVEIWAFHKQFTQALEEKYNNYHKYQIFGDIIKKNVPFFKLYVDYILNMNDGAGNDFIKLEKQNPKIEDICRKFMDEKQKKATDEIAQPTFRIARYQALFSQIIKKTSPQHPDYQIMTAAKELFLKTISGVNNTVDKIVRINKLNQLQQQFGPFIQPISVQEREYLAQFQMELIREGGTESAILYVFNDFLLVVNIDLHKIVQRIELNQKYSVKRQEDTKTYKNLIKINAEGVTTLSGGNKEMNLKKTEEAYQLLRSLQKQDRKNIANAVTQVEVLGTEEIGSTSFAKHTQYIIEIKYLDLKKLLHLRFSDLERIVTEMKACYSSDLGIQQDETLKKNWLNNHKSAIIEGRKRTIQTILYKMFNHPLIKNQPQHLLNFLNMDPDFFKIARNTVQRFSNISMNQQKSFSKREMKQALMILCATEVKLGRDIYHDSEKNQKMATKKILVKITLLTGEQRTVLVNQFTTVQDICNKVSKLIGLRTNRDFRLFHEIGKKQLRVLDNEQYLMKIFDLKQSTEESSGIINGFFGGLKKIFSPSTNPILLFKKYYFLPYQIEQSEFRKDLTRLKLLTYQVFSQIKQMKYHFTFDQYLLFLAMLIYIQNEGDTKKQIDNNIIHKIIPETIFKLKNYNQDQWILKAQHHVLKIHSQIQKLIVYNTQQLKLNQVKIDTPSKISLYFGHKHLCSQMTLNKIKSNPIYGSNLFYVQPHKTTYDQLTKKGKKMAYNMWLAIKVQSLTLLTPASKQIQLLLHYKNIQKIDVFSQAIEFRMDKVQTEIYRLNTYQSFQISQLVKYNKALNSVLDEMKTSNNSKSMLMSKAKSYKQDLTAYRYTQDQQ